MRTPQPDRITAYEALLALSTSPTFTPVVREYIAAVLGEHRDLANDCASNAYRVYHFVENRRAIRGRLPALAGNCLLECASWCASWNCRGAQMNPIRILYRAWLRLELKHVTDAKADAMDAHRTHGARIRGLDAEAAELRWKLLGSRPSQKYGLQALRQRRGKA